MTTYPMRDQHGDLIPEVADYMRGMRVLAQLRATGLDLAPDQTATAALGRALRESEHDRDLELVQDLVAKIQERNLLLRMELEMVPGRDLDRLPDRGTTITPNLTNRSDRTGVGVGGTDPASAEQVGDSVLFDPIKEYLKNTRDEPDEEWS